MSFNKETNENLQHFEVDSFIEKSIIILRWYIEGQVGRFVGFCTEHRKFV